MIGLEDEARMLKPFFLDMMVARPAMEDDHCRIMLAPLFDR